MAARIRKELGEEVTMVHGNYGEFRVLVDDEEVANGGALAVLGVLPSGRKVLELVRARLGR